MGRTLVFLSRLQDDWSKGATEHCDRRKILGLPQVKSTPEVSKVNAALLVRNISVYRARRVRISI
jgi:hypothetical protein